MNRLRDHLSALGLLLDLLALALFLGAVVGAFFAALFTVAGMAPG